MADASSSGQVRRKEDDHAFVNNIHKSLSTLISWRFSYDDGSVRYGDDFVAYVGVPKIPFRYLNTLNNVDVALMFMVGCNNKGRWLFFHSRLMERWTQKLGATLSWTPPP